MEKKLTLELGHLCEGLPIEFQEMLAYIRTLHFSSEPDYDFLEEKLKQIAINEGFDLAHRDFDWIQVVKKKIAEKQRLSEHQLHARTWFYNFIYETGWYLQDLDL